MTRRTEPRDTPRRIWIRFPAAILAAACGSLLTAQATPDRTDVNERTRPSSGVLAVLRTAGECSEGNAKRSEAALWRLGPGSIPEMIDILLDGEGGAESRTGSVAPPAGGEREILLRVLGRHRPAAVARALELCAAEDPRQGCARLVIGPLRRLCEAGLLPVPPAAGAVLVLERKLVAEHGVDRRLRLLQVLREIGPAASAPLLVDLCAGLGAVLSASPAGGRLAEETIAAMIRRDAAMVGRLRGLWRRLPPRAVPLFVAGIATSRDSSAIGMLGAVLERGDGMDSAGATALAAASAEDGIPLDERVLAGVRRLLAAPAPESRAVAAAALGRLRDHGSVESLLEALDDDDALVRDAALEALRLISSRADPLAAPRWRAWWESEVAWWDVAGPAWLEDLDAGEVSTLAAALRTALAHPAFRAEFAEAVGPRLDELDPGVRAMALAALRHLGGPHALAVLRRSG